MSVSTEGKGQIVQFWNQILKTISGSARDTIVLPDLPSKFVYLKNIHFRKVWVALMCTIFGKPLIWQINDIARMH